VTYRKGENKITNKFTNQYLTGGGTSATGTAPEKTLLGTPITYTFNTDGKNYEASTPYLSVSGTSFVGGYQNAIIYVKATAEETDVLDALTKTIQVIVGDSAQAVNVKEMDIPVMKTVANGITLKFVKDGLSIVSGMKGTASVSVFDVNGKEILSKSVNVNAGSSWVSLQGLKAGSYIAMMNMGSQKATIKFNK
jgi:endoglucanase